MSRQSLRLRVIINRRSFACPSASPRLPLSHRKPSLPLLIHLALQHGHLHPAQFTQLSNAPTPSQLQELDQLAGLLFGSLILNDQQRANYYLNRIEATKQPGQLIDDFYPNLFKVCGLIGRGMGMMRRVMSVQLKSPSPNTRIIEAYIENLVRWAQIERAWSLLTHFDFGPSIDLSVQARSIGGRFFKRVSRIKTKPTSFANQPWTPNESAYASLLSIYLILDRPDLALALDSSSTHLHKFDQCMALIICAKASMSACQQPEQQHCSQEQPPVPVGPITTAVMAKYIYQQEGTDGLIRWIEQQQATHSSNRLLLSVWLDILLLPSDDAPLEPRQLTSWIQRLDQLQLLGERELEKYLRYTREWLEAQIRQKIRLRSAQPPLPHQLPHASSSSDLSITIDPNDPRLGYPQLIDLFMKVYNQNLTPAGATSSCSSSSSSSSVAAAAATRDFQHFKPSPIVMSEMVRILAMIGTLPQTLSELMDREMQENQGQMRSTHMMGLVWSRIVHQDWAGLSSLVDREMKLKYKLVLTGLLTTIILAGLIATRAPKPMMIKMSQKLIEQCPSSPHHHALNKNHQHHLSHARNELDSVQAYLNLMHAADAMGDFLLIKELHEAMVAKFGREKVWAEEGRAGCLDYVDLVFQAYMKLNEPLLAQTEVSCSFEYLTEHYHELSTTPQDPTPLPSPCAAREDSKRFLSSGVLRSFLEAPASSKLVETPRPCGVQEEGVNEGGRQKYERFTGNLTRAGQQIARKLESLRRLRRLFTSRTAPPSAAKGEQEWQAARLAEIEARLAKFDEAQEMNARLLARFHALLRAHPPASPPPSPAAAAAAAADDPGLAADQREPHSYKKALASHPDAQWNNAMDVALGLIRKLVD